MPKPYFPLQRSTAYLICFFNDERKKVRTVTIDDDEDSNNKDCYLIGINSAFHARQFSRFRKRFVIKSSRSMED